jgi:DNA-directed RNA polymerase beta' subunit
VLSSISADANIYQWFINNWINLVVIHPETRELYVFNTGKFTTYTPLTQTISTINNIDNLLEDNIENLPVCLI